MQVIDWVRDPRQLRELRAAAVTMAAVLGSFGTALVIEHLAGLHVQVLILAVVLAITLRRTQRRRTHLVGDIREHLLPILVVPLVAAACVAVATLMRDHPSLGDPLFVIAVSAGIWLRRFGPLATRAGTLLALPFITILITPAPAAGGRLSWIWAAAVALVAVFWASAVSFVDSRLSHRGSAPERAPVSAPKPQAPAPRTPAARTPVARTPMPASTKMAAQMAVALGASFVIGRWLFPQHWPWLVLTAYIVSSGNRGRGDVAHKSVLRVIGAAGGTAVATLVSGHFAAGDRTPIVLIFIILAIATWLREVSYAFWAAGITSVLALLNGYFGESGNALLAQRLGGIVIGAVIALAAAWFVLPISTGAVIRRRIATALAGLTDYVTTARRDPTGLIGAQHRVDALLDEVAEVAGPGQRYRRLLRRVTNPRILAANPDPVEQLLDLRPALHGLTKAVLVDPLAVRGPEAKAELEALHQRVVEARRAMAAASAADRPDPRRTIDLESITRIRGAVDLATGTLLS